MCQVPRVVTHLILSGTERSPQPSGSRGDRARRMFRRASASAIIWNATTRQSGSSCSTPATSERGSVQRLEVLSPPTCAQGGDDLLAEQPGLS
jgi:hypothetical protein